MQGKQDRRIIFVQGLLVIILHHPDDLHRLVDRLYRKTFPQGGLGRSKTEYTDSRFIQDDIVDVATEILGKTTAGNKLQIVRIQVIHVAAKHFQQTGLLGGIAQADDGKEVGNLRPGNSTGNSYILHGRQRLQLSFHRRQLRRQLLAMSREFQHQRLIRTDTQRSTPHILQLSIHDQRPAQQSQRRGILQHHQHLAGDRRILRMRKLPFQHPDRLDTGQDRCRIEA